ncbi:expansin EXLX1 family cellulose-binding protein [Streptomyces sp. Amel2xC10]|uniref:expansin EXLX1 family cellulose-binding protein n=1 Tax=Streptomyces sp. Amel2xC10 TaxID=1305826 RepID=UPI000A089E0C|nr:expansin EXLX1 family cellulose-binding protein [Streptomyces sp. Amel2xC10]SMF66633.1 Peptidoglycan-binding domain-containing protein, expansin [Streptomyces sp. Amel2xC10]
MPSASHRRHRAARPERRTARASVVSVVALAAVALVVSLVVAFRPDGGSGEPAAAPAASAKASASPSVSAEPSTASPSPTAGKKKESVSPTPTPSAPSPSTSARPAPRTPAATGSLAGRIRPGASYRGVATSYDIGDGDGACSFGPSSDVMTAAMNTTDYETSKACGAYVQVRAGGKSITVRITNECPAPCVAGQLDLSREAFAKLAPLSAGRITVDWSLLSPATSDTVSIRYKTGSSRYWCGIQALGHRNPLARLEVRTGDGSWLSLPRAEYNYFLSEQGTGCGGAIRLTDIYGERLTVEGLAVRAEAVQGTGVQFARR